MKFKTAFCAFAKFFPIVALIGFASSPLAAEEISYAASEICVSNNSAGTRDLNDHAIALNFSYYATAYCHIPKDVNRGVGRAYVRIKPGASRTGNARTVCRLNSVHPYGQDYTPTYWGGLHFSDSSSNFQSIVVSPPSQVHKWGHLVVRCNMSPGDKLFGVHIVQ